MISTFEKVDFGSTFLTGRFWLYLSYRWKRWKRWKEKIDLILIILNDFNIINKKRTNGYRRGCIRVIRERTQ